ncbi:uncharacterized protein LOC142544506 [Primulina tabacum]|uniref:uncharacterized protein LOC142544506 n=1 Tax=Primulina tabacum TaxID=48773 RepID=UPI003F5A5620
MATSPLPVISTSSATDSFTSFITHHMLNGQNYLAWSRSVLMFVSGKRKDDYLIGMIQAPEEDDPGHRVWKTNNNMVKTWLISSMTTKIGEGFLMYDTAAEIWDHAITTQSNIDNTSELFEIECCLHDLRQGDSSVTHYYTILVRIWQKLDLYDQHKWTCPADAHLYNKIIETKRVLKMLSGLNKEFDDVRGRILSIKPLPSLQEAFSSVRH